MFWRVKRSICVGCAAAVFAIAAFVLYTVRTVRIALDAPELVFVGREFYLYSPSSQAEIKTEIAWYEYGAIEGESAEYCILEGAGTDLLAYARRKCEELGGTERFVEEVDGVVSVYAYAPELYEGIEVYGARVNLQIAVCGDRLVVGSPIIFGGY